MRRFNAIAVITVIAATLAGCQGSGMPPVSPVPEKKPYTFKPPPQTEEPFVLNAGTPALGGYEIDESAAKPKAGASAAAPTPAPPSGEQAEPQMGAAQEAPVAPAEPPKETPPAPLQSLQALSLLSGATKYYVFIPVAPTLEIPTVAANGDVKWAAFPLQFDENNHVYFENLTTVDNSNWGIRLKWNGYGTSQWTLVEAADPKIFELVDGVSLNTASNPNVRYLRLKKPSDIDVGHIAIVKIKDETTSYGITFSKLRFVDPSAQKIDLKPSCPFTNASIGLHVVDTHASSTLSVILKNASGVSLAHSDAYGLHGKNGPRNLNVVLKPDPACYSADPLKGLSSVVVHLTDGGIFDMEYTFLSLSIRSGTTTLGQLLVGNLPKGEVDGKAKDIPLAFPSAFGGVPQMVKPKFNP